MISKLSNPDMVQPTDIGATGVVHSLSAIPNEPSMFGVQVLGRFFTDPAFIDSEKHSRNSLRLSGNYTISDRLELFGGFNFVFNEHSNADTSRSSTSFFENTDLGAKYSFPVVQDCCFVGFVGDLRFFSGERAPRNTSGFSSQSEGPWLSGMALVISTIDMRYYLKKFPLRLHGNLGYRAPNSTLVPSTGTLANRNTQIEIFNLDAIKYHSIVGTFAAEFPYRWLTPFIEYWGEYALFSSKDSYDYANNRHKISIGTRINPHPAFAIIGGADFGFNGNNAGATVGMPTSMPWEAFFGVSFQTQGNRLSQSEGSVRGRVLDGDTGLPLSDVEATLVGEVTLPKITDLSGYYEIPNLNNGKYQVRFQKVGYESQTQEFQVKDGKNVVLDIALDSLGPKKGNLRGKVIDTTTGEPIARAFIQVSGMDHPLVTDESGSFSADDLREGPQNIRVEAPGYLPKDFPIEILPKETLDQSFALEKELPKIGQCLGRVTNTDGTGLTAVFSIADGSIPPFGTDPLTGKFTESLNEGVYDFEVRAENYLPGSARCEVKAGEQFEVNVILEKPKTATLVENKIILPEAIFFAFDSDKIDKRSFKILDQIVKILKENDEVYEQLKIDGHTDSVGSDAYNQDLSERRANSVRDYLIQKGVNADKLVAHGFGESQPVATNVTDEGRSENRRVEFNLVRPGIDE